jgi:hypothetical protein
MVDHAVIDRPGERSSHTIPTPRGGGVATVLAITTGLLLVPGAATLVLPLTLFAAIGLVEDLWGVPVFLRLAVQIGVACPASAAIAAFTGAAGIVVISAAVWFTAYVNAFGFMDGINGISALSAVLAGVVHAVLGLAYDRPLLTAAGAVVAAAAATFLPRNLARAKIFLGDVGSYGLGGVIGGLAVYAVLCGGAGRGGRGPTRRLPVVAPRLRWSPPYDVDTAPPSADVVDALARLIDVPVGRSGALRTCEVVSRLEGAPADVSRLGFAVPARLCPAPAADGQGRRDRRV